MGDSIELQKINSFLLNDFNNYNIDKLYNKLLINQFILKLENYNDTTNNYNDKLLNKTLIDITINDILEDNINYYLDDFKLNNENIIGSIDIDLSYYASNEIKYYSMILDFLTEYYKNLANIIKNNEYLDNKSLYDHEFEIKMRYDFEGSRIKQLNKNKILKFKVVTSQDISGYKDIVVPNNIMEDYKLFEINEGEMTEIEGEGVVNSYKTFIKNYIIDNNYLNFDINKIDYYFLLTKSYLYKFYKLLLNYHISKAIYFYYQNKYENKVPEINDIISNKFPEIFENFELILNSENNDLSILKIVENTKKKQKVLEEKKKKEINKLSDRIKILEESGGDQGKIQDLKDDLNNLYANGYITTDQAKVNEAIRYKKDLHNINKNLIDNEEKIKKLDDTIKRDKSYLNQVNIIMYICIFVLIIIFFTFSITNLTNINISVAIVLLIISMILYFSSNYYINNSNHEHKKTNLFSNLFNNFIIIENYDDPQSVSGTDNPSTEEPIQEDVRILLQKLKGQFNDDQIDNIIDSLKGNTRIINEAGYVTGTIAQGTLTTDIDDIIDTQYDNDSPDSQYKNSISLKKKDAENTSFYDLVASSSEDNTLEANLSKLFDTSPPSTVYESLYNEIENTNGDIEYNVIILPNDGSDFTEYELNIPSYFGDSFKLDYDSNGVLTEQKIEREDIQMDIIVVGGGSAGQSFTKPNDVDKENVIMTELGSGGSGGAVIYKENFSFTPGKYTIGVGKGGVGNNNTETIPEQSKIKSGRGSYIKTEDSGEISNKKNNFIIFACGGIYHDDVISKKKISKSGGTVDIVNEFDYKFQDKYNEINVNIINIPGITTVAQSEGLILNSETSYSRGGEGGDLDLSDVGNRAQLYVSNDLTTGVASGYAVYYNQGISEENRYSGSKKNGKNGIEIQTISHNIISESYSDRDRIVVNNTFYISGGGGAIGVCSNKSGITEVENYAGTKLFIACNEGTDIGGSGGTGGGGRGNHSSHGEHGLPGTGSGGGGGGYQEAVDDNPEANFKGGDGGSGVVILKYNKQVLKGKFDDFKKEKKNEIKTILLQTIANGNLLKFESAFQDLRSGIQRLNAQKKRLEGLKDRSETLRSDIGKELDTQEEEEAIRDMNLYGYFKKNGTGNTYEIKHINDDSITIYRNPEIDDYLEIKNDEDPEYGFEVLDPKNLLNIKNNLKSIFDKQPNDKNELIPDSTEVNFLIDNRDNIKYIDEIYVPGVVYLRDLHVKYISELRTYYQTYGSLLNQNSAIEEQIALLDGELSSLDAEIDELESKEIEELGKKALEETRNSNIVRNYNAEIVKQAQGNLCLSIVNELIIGLQKKLQEQNSQYTSDKMLLNAQLTYLQKQAIKEKNAAREAKEEALRQQAQSEKDLEQKRKDLFDQLQDQDLPENKKSFLIDFEFDLDYRIAGNLLDGDDIGTFGQENVKKQNEKRKRFESKIKRELYDALKETYKDSDIDITPNRFEINRISSGNLYDVNRTRQNTGYLTAAETLQRAFMDQLSGGSTIQQFTVEEHFAIGTPKTLEENRMVVEMEILPNSMSFFESNYRRNTARDILYKILNVSSCKSDPTGVDEVEPDMINIDINSCTKQQDESKELLNNLSSQLRIKRYFRYLTRYRVGAGMNNFIAYYLEYAGSTDKDIVRNKVDSTWIEVVRTDGLITDTEILADTYSKIDDINDHFTEIDKLRFQQETYYDKMNPLLKKEYKKYDEIENNNNIYKKMKQQSDNINTYDIRLKETLINYFVTLSILVSLYLVIIHYINHIVVLLILILIIVVMSIFLLMNIYQIVKTRANKNYWPKENKFLQINI